MASSPWDVDIDGHGVPAFSETEGLLEVKHFMAMVAYVYLVVTMETAHAEIVAWVRKHVSLIRHPLVLQEVKDTPSCLRQMLKVETHIYI